MNKIPLHFLALFTDLHAGDELILHKGPGLANWKIEVLQMNPRWDACPLPRSVWLPVLSTLPAEWQGNVRFYWCPELSAVSHSSIAPWLATVKTCPPVDIDKGMVDIS